MIGTATFTVKVLYTVHCLLDKAERQHAVCRFLILRMIIFVRVIPLMMCLIGLLMAVISDSVILFIKVFHKSCAHVFAGPSEYGRAFERFLAPQPSQSNKLNASWSAKKSGSMWDTAFFTLLRWLLHES